jgi:hypothetical protein
MATFPEEITVIDRVAVTVSLTPVFLAWINSIDPINSTIDDLGGNTYLLPEVDGDITEIREFVDKHYRFFFEQELFSWYTDDTLWPKRLTRKMFYEWFNIEVSDMIFDTMEALITKE